MTALCVTPGSAEWLEERKKYIGASDAPTICSLTPNWRTPRELAKEKLDKSLLANEDNKYLKRGRLLEPLVKHFYIETTGNELFSAPMYRHKEHDWMSATPDAWIVGDNFEALLECKTAARFTREDWLDIDPSGNKTDIVPKKYWVQLQHQLAVTAETEGYVAVLFASDDLFDLLVRMTENGKDVTELYELAKTAVDFRIIKVKRDEVFISGLIEKERNFWNDLKQGILPDDNATLQDSGGIRLADSQEEQLINSFKEAYQQKVISEQHFNHTSQTIKDAIGRDSGLYSDRLGKVTFKKSRQRRKTDWKHLAEDLLSKFINTPEQERIKALYTKCEEASRRLSFPHKMWMLG